MNEQARAALEAIKREYPDWTIVFIDGYRPFWQAWRIFDSPAALVTIECRSARALRARLWGSSWIITPKDFR